MALAASQDMKSYFNALQKEAERCYEVAIAARKKGFDPEVTVEIPMAKDLASRVEKLLNLDGVASLIRETSKGRNREETSILVAKKVAQEMKSSKSEALDTAVRVGLAVLTEGILVAPLDGIASVKVNGTGSNTYASISFAGPIRSAGGTGQAMSVLIADIVRRELDIGAYKATEEEVERLKEEIPLYKQAQHLQYQPTEKEIELVVGNCPVCVDGEGTEEIEISGYRNLPRISTNRVRGGACLVIAEGLCQKASKILKHVKKLEIDGWSFVEDVVKLKGNADENSTAIMEPSSKFIKDLVAGRPVYSHPSRKGGFRLRYGRSRTAGLASISIHPATMYILGETLAVGTQMKIERPGKAGIATPCDQLEGPLVLLNNNDLVKIRSVEQAKGLGLDQIKEIVDLGEILIPVGEFLENNHPLVPGVFDLGWYIEELRRAGIEEPEKFSSATLEIALSLAKEKGVPLHPAFIFFWNNLTIDQVNELRDLLLDGGRFINEELQVPDKTRLRELLVELGAPHKSGKSETIVVENGRALMASLGLDSQKEKKQKGKKKEVFKDALSYVSSLAGVRIGNKCGTVIGARMARPEKADSRKMDPPVHGLFPVGTAGGPQRLLNKAEDAQGRDVLKIDMDARFCKECGKACFLSVCECGCHTTSRGRPESQKVDMADILDAARTRLGIEDLPKVKGVQGMISKNKTPEMPDKGILRARHEVFVFKDGTSRFDCTDAPLTHFRPREMGTSVEKLRALGYSKDMNGKELGSEDQLVELKVQDIILPESGINYLVQVAGFIDELLERFYGLEPYYKAKGKEDMIGASLLGLSPHTSGGVLCRLIGYTRASVSYAHPFFHAAKRRNCDGDEDCYMLLLDGLLNFSVSFLPEKIGGRMDAPLVLMTAIDPDEIDKEAHNIDVMSRYPIELYDASLKNANPRSIESKLDIVGNRIGSMLQYEHMGFTLDTDDIAAGPKASSYKTLKTMDEKTQLQLELAMKIRAVDARDVAERLITNHFLPDMIGNLKSFSSQKVRCTKCGEKYRRMPLAGQCECGNKLILTVHEASVRKYLDISKHIADDFKVSPYIHQRIEIMEESMNSMFQNGKSKATTLGDFF